MARASSKPSMTACGVRAEAERHAGALQRRGRSDAVAEVPFGGRAQAAAAPLGGEPGDVGRRPSGCRGRR